MAIGGFHVDKDDTVLGLAVLILIGAGIQGGRILKQWELRNVIAYAQKSIHEDEELYEKVLEGYAWIDIAVADIEWFARNQKVLPHDALIDEMNKRLEFTHMLASQLPRGTKTKADRAMEQAEE